VACWSWEVANGRAWQKLSPSGAQEDYRAVGAEGDPPPPPDAIGPHHLPPDARAPFDEVAALRYPFAVKYGARDYLANLRTQLAEPDGVVRGSPNGQQSHFAGCQESLTSSQKRGLGTWTRQESVYDGRETKTTGA
jgi:hypothetical protein